MSEFGGEFWIVAVATEGKGKESVYAGQRTSLSRFCSVHPFEMPRLRISAVDELLNLNEKLMKYDNQGRSVIQRLVRCYREYMDQPDGMPQVRDRSLYRYVPTFTWEKGRFSLQSKLPPLVDEIQERLVTTHERLKTLIDKYKKVAQKIAAEARANEGNLMVCDLQKFVKPADYVDGEYITTALCVVPAQKTAEFEATYWKLEQTAECEKVWLRNEQAKAKAAGDDPVGNLEMSAEDRKKYEVVAPDSCQLLEKQSDFSLYRVVLLKRGLQWFTEVCREFRYNVRDFVYKPPDQKAMDAEEMKKIKKEESDKKKRLIMFCNHTFADTVEQWLHLKMIRVFVEAILRYGPGEGNPTARFATSILKVNGGQGGTLALALKKLYAHLESSDMTADDEGGPMMGMQEMRPYIFVPVMANFD